MLLEARGCRCLSQLVPGGSLDQAILSANLLHSASSARKIPRRVATKTAIAVASRGSLHAEFAERRRDRSAVSGDGAVSAAVNSFPEGTRYRSLPEAALTDITAEPPAE